MGDILIDEGIASMIERRRYTKISIGQLSLDTTLPSCSPQSVSRLVVLARRRKHACNMLATCLHSCQVRSAKGGKCCAQRGDNVTRVLVVCLEVLFAGTGGIGWTTTRCAKCPGPLSRRERWILAWRLTDDVKTCSPCRRQEQRANLLFYAAQSAPRA